MSGKNLPHRFTYEDLREWIGEADKLGEVRYLDGLSWEREIGMVAELLNHSDPAPAALFDNVPGCAKGFRVLTNFFGGKRQNMTLGFSQGLSRLELSEVFSRSTRTRTTSRSPTRSSMTARSSRTCSPATRWT